MKIPAILALVALLGGVDADRALPHKAWHQSPSPNPLSDSLYFVVPWEAIQKIRVGMSEAEVQTVVGGLPLQYYHHSVNAIFYSHTPRGRDVEVALKRSPTGAVEDISYKLLGPVLKPPS